MAEAIAAVAVVSSIIACVEFAGKLTIETLQFAKSTSDTLPENRRLAELACENEYLAVQLRSIRSDGKDHIHEKNVQEKAIQCHEECRKLLTILESLKGNTTIQKIAAALKSRRNQSKLAACRDRVKELQGQLSLALITLIQSDQRNEFSSLKNYIEERHKEGTSSSEQIIANITSQIRDMQVNDSIVTKIISSLEFPSMSQRRHDVVDAAFETFEWPFEESPIANWLQEGSGIFWVRGKAASGKSTLMKHIGDDDRTYNRLKIWANGKKLIVADHFFWIAGTSSQRSYQGMLQTLLHSIFTKDRSLVPTACRSRCKTSDSSARDRWSTRELFECLCACVGKDDVRYCFFLDGLDEYHPQEEHITLVNHLKQLTKYANVKLCVSSRGWTIFENAFGHSDRSIRLEDVTRNDMRKFVCSRLLASKSESDQTVRSDGTLEIYGLVNDIVDKAEGVFLWTHLVLSSMHDRLLAGIGLEGLRQCLREFPSDLEQYIRNLVWNRINQTWLKGRPSETACALKLSMRINDDYGYFRDSTLLVLLSYWLVLISKDCDIGRRDFYKQIRVKCIEENISQICSEIVRMLKQACKDILKITQEGAVWNSRIEFSHRSMYDFLKTAEMQTFLNDHIPGHFLEPDFAARLKIAVSKLRTASKSEMGEECSRCLFLPYHPPGVGSVAECDELLQECEASVFEHAQLCEDRCVVHCPEVCGTDFVSESAGEHLPNAFDNWFYVLGEFIRHGLYRALETYFPSVGHYTRYYFLAAAFGGIIFPSTRVDISDMRSLPPIDLVRSLFERHRCTRRGLGFFARQVTSWKSDVQLPRSAKSDAEAIWAIMKLFLENNVILSDTVCMHTDAKFKLENLDECDGCRHVCDLQPVEALLKQLTPPMHQPELETLLERAEHEPMEVSDASESTVT
ncbi:MAG: hypothetical protein M1820_005485 [Bogoriella megaspora]|nr:MAG: hypothetical protein M1820_005485 [Bogoriella megaspora]